MQQIVLNLPQIEFNLRRWQAYHLASTKYGFFYGCYCP